MAAAFAESLQWWLDHLAFPRIGAIYLGLFQFRQRLVAILVDAVDALEGEWVSWREWLGASGSGGVGGHSNL